MKKHNWMVLLGVVAFFFLAFMKDSPWKIIPVIVFLGSMWGYLYFGYIDKGRGGSK